MFLILHSSVSLYRNFAEVVKSCCKENASPTIVKFIVSPNSLHFYLRLRREQVCLMSAQI